MTIDLKGIHAVLQEEHKGLYADEDQDGYSARILTKDQLSVLAMGD